MKPLRKLLEYSMYKILMESKKSKIDENRDLSIDENAWLLILLTVHCVQYTAVLNYNILMWV